MSRPTPCSCEERRFQKGATSMSEERKQIEENATQTEQEVKPAELSDQDLDKVAGGGYNGGNTGSGGVTGRQGMS
jgi:hypothetical protein